MAEEFRSFAEFYPFYLKEHGSRDNRRMHFLGMVTALAVLFAAAVSWKWWLLPAVPAVGYFLSWVGHFVFEHNRPASFRHPLYSFRGDLAMFRDILLGRIEI
ncbi:MAG: Mpo1-like protein [Gemmataceae bacterium]